MVLWKRMKAKFIFLRILRIKYCKLKSNNIIKNQDIIILTTVRSPSRLLKIFWTAGSLITSAFGSIKVTTSPKQSKSKIFGLNKLKFNKFNFLNSVYFPERGK